MAFPWVITHTGVPPAALFGNTRGDGTPIVINQSTSIAYYLKDGVVTAFSSGGGGTGTVTSVGATAPVAGFTISGSPITTAGTFVFTLANDLAAVEGLSATGLVRRTATDVWSAGTLVTLAEMANLATKHYIGRTSSGTGVPEAVPAATTMRADLGEKVSTLTDGATISLDATLSNSFRVTLGGNRTLSNPTGLIDGQMFLIRVIQDATGTRTLTLGSKYRVPSGVFVLSTAASSKDLMACQYDSTDDTIWVVLNKAFQ